MQNKQHTVSKGKFKKYRFKVLLLIIGLVYPLSLIAFTLIGSKSYAFFSMLFAILSIIPFLMIYEMKKPQAREWIPLAVMAALAAISRVAFAPIPFFKPTSAIIIITSSVFGGEAGFMTGAISALASNLVFGQGPWTPWQMFGWGMIGFLSGYLIKKNIINNKFKLYVFGSLTGFIFGWIMNIYSVIGYIYEFSWISFFTLYISSFIPDLIHSVCTVITLRYLYDPWRAKLNRVKVKFGLVNIDF